MKVTKQMDEKKFAEILNFYHSQTKVGNQVTGTILKEKFDLTTNYSEKFAFLFGNLDTIQSLLLTKQDFTSRRLASDLKTEKAKIKNLMNIIEELELRNEHLVSTTNNSTYQIPHLQSSNEINSEAVAIAILSDVHIEERVEAETIYGINEYNPEIGAERVAKFFVNLKKQIYKERQNVHIDTLVLGLLGDFITGYIHEELRESNFMSPTESVMFIKGLLMSGLKMLSEECELKRIIIPCCKGNHGRNTDRKRHATAYKNSYEWMLYHDIANTFKIMGGYDNLEFIIPTSELTYVKVYEKTLRFGHGDHFKFIGGVGGLAIPLMKFLYRINEVTHADMSFFGHYHQMLRPSSNCVMNGSLIGYNAYAASIGAKPEEPMQQFLLLDKKRGFTVSTPILCT